MDILRNVFLLHWTPRAYKSLKRWWVGDCQIGCYKHPSSFQWFSKDVVIRFLDFGQVVSSHDHGNCKSLIARMVHSRAIIVIVLTSPPGLASGKIYRKYRETKPSIFIVKAAFIFTHACARMHTHARHAHHAHHQSIHPPVCLPIHQSIHPSTYVSHPIWPTSHILTDWNLEPRFGNFPYPEKVPRTTRSDLGKIDKTYDIFTFCETVHGNQNLEPLRKMVLGEPKMTTFSQFFTRKVPVKLAE